jgi:hypothetical protein
MFEGRQLEESIFNGFGEPSKRFLFAVLGASVVAVALAGALSLVPDKSVKLKEPRPVPASQMQHQH